MEALSKKLQLEIESRLKTGPYSTVEELISAALAVLDERLQLEVALGVGLDSPERIPADADFYEQKRRELRDRHRAG